MAAGVEEQDFVAFADGQPGWWVPRGETEGMNFTVLPKGEFMTHANVLEICHLDWEVEKVPAYHQNPESGLFVPVEREYWIRRTDNFQVLGRVGERYEMLQNRSAAEYCDFLLEGGYVFDTGGSLFGNRTVFLLMKLGEDIILGGDPRERIESWLVFTNTHDGSGSITFAVVKIRVVCANTLAWALKGATRTYKVRHTESMEGKMQEARKALDISFKYDAKFQVEAERLIDKKLTEEDLMKMLDNLVPLTDEHGEQKTGRGYSTAVSTRSSILGLYADADNLKHLPECAYRFVQAVEEYSDHYSIFRNTDTATAPDNRFRKMVEGKTLGAQAYALVAA